MPIDLLVPFALLLAAAGIAWLLFDLPRKLRLDRLARAPERLAAREAMRRGLDEAREAYHAGEIDTAAAALERAFEARTRGRWHPDDVALLRELVFQAGAILPGIGAPFASIDPVLQIASRDRLQMRALSDADTALLDALVAAVRAKGRAHEIARTPLIRAASRGELDRVRELVESGVDVNFVPPALGRSALDFAAARGHEAVARYLLERGADAGGVRADGTSALGWALEWEQWDLAELLLRRGADARVRVSGEDPALCWAILSERADLIDLLLERGADPDAPGHGDPSAIELAAAREDPALFERLLAASRDPAARPKYLGAALTAAAERGDAGRVRSLLDRRDWGERAEHYRAAEPPGADRVPPDALAMTIAAAARQGHLGVLEELCARGADLAGRHREAGTAGLTAAASIGSLAIVTWLLARGVPAAARNPWGIAPVVAAAGSPLLAQGEPEADRVAAVVRALLAAGAEADARDRQGRSALDLASAQRHGRAVAALLAAVIHPRG